MPDYGVIKEVFPSQEDIVNNEVETNIIEEPEEDPTIPTEDADSGEGGAGLPVQMEFANRIEPDSNDIIWPVEEIELNEPAVVAEEYNVEPVVLNQATLPTLGAVKTGERCIIALINGEATVIGTVGSGDAQNARIAAVEQVAGDTNQYFWHTSTGTDTGAHITQIPQEQFLTTPSGGNTLIRSNGIAIRNGMDELATFTNNQITLGKTDDYHIKLTPTAYDMSDAYGVSYFTIGDTSIAPVPMEEEIIDEFAADDYFSTGDANYPYGYKTSELISSVISLDINGEEYTDYKIATNLQSIWLKDLPEDGFTLDY